MADSDTRSGKRSADAPLLDYLDRMHAPHEGGLQQAFDAPGSSDLPAIQVGLSEGKLLELLLRMVGARRVVEIGTLAGFSAMRLARGLAEDGHVWTIEAEAKHAQVARRNIESAGLGDRITVVLADALEALPTLERHGPFCAVFVDADKERYDHYGAWAAAHTRSGGLLLGDNAYFFGRLLEESDAAAAMRRFHQQTRDHYDTVCIPTPDGLLLGVHR